MSIFNTKPTKEFLAVVAALKTLPLVERKSAFAESYEGELKADFAESLGTSAKGRRSWVRLIGKKVDPSSDDSLPADDHTEIWDNGDGLTYVSHPYQVRLQEMREIVAACDEHGLDCIVDAKSWYYPGGTVKLTWTRKTQP